MPPKKIPFSKKKQQPKKPRPRGLHGDKGDYVHPSKRIRAAAAAEPSQRKEAVTTIPCASGLRIVIRGVAAGNATPVPQKDDGLVDTPPSRASARVKARAVSRAIAKEPVEAATPVPRSIESHAKSPPSSTRSSARIKAMASRGPTNLSQELRDAIGSIPEDDGDSVPEEAAPVVDPNDESEGAGTVGNDEEEDGTEATEKPKAQSTPKRKKGSSKGQFLCFPSFCSLLHHVVSTRCLSRDEVSSTEHSLFPPPKPCCRVVIALEKNRIRKRSLQRRSLERNLDVLPQLPRQLLILIRLWFRPLLDCQPLTRTLF